ncbi:hypothetical protein [Microbacterium hydrocarbonoxydans]|uniref:Protein ImuA n=1 Tax=Microbacterium hydrocarbonoxydans TaxID=273678 RepID=A0A1H4KSW1_9MICO|nr:hypothetical protein [Microbacterium hydrocarbonoxydans]SEB61614.1 hypothetical protein SAMN04489807_1533 [Microbacterium hydrocarbonoxydans]
MGIGLDAVTALSPAGDSRAGEVLRLRREISRMQRRRSEHQLLPLDPAFSSLLPEQGLQTGTAYTVSPSPSLILALLAAASQRGHWCAVVGMPTLGVEAAAAFGIELPRLILVPEPGDRWLAATSALAEVVPLIAVQPGSRARDADVSRLSARLRDRGSTLLVAETTASGAWPQSEGSIRLHDQHWLGVGEGWGLIEGSTATVTARTRHSPQPSSVRVRLPGAQGAVEQLPSESIPAETVTELTALPGLRGDGTGAREYPLAVAG